MFRTKAFRLIVVCLLALGLFTPGAQAQRKKQLAVLNFDFATVDIGLANHAYGGQENLARAISDKLVNTLVAQNTCVVIERSQLEKVLYEQNLGNQGRIDPSTAAKVGRILGVDAIIIGNVSVFDLQGTPKNSRDTSWDPKQLRARIAVNFRVVDTTTAVVQASSEATGVSGQAAPASTGTQIAKDAVDSLGGIGNIFGGSKVGRVIGRIERRDSTTTVTEEQIRNVVQLAVDDVVGQITMEVEKYLAGSRRQPETTPSTERHLNGRVSDVQGPTVFITGIDRSAV
ncbi:MAG: CsgG/HfaB family protein, partial [Blastocatellia bacterium]